MSGGGGGPGGEAQRAGDWEMSDGLMSAMGLGDLGGSEALGDGAGHGGAGTGGVAPVQRRARGTAPVQLRAQGSSPAIQALDGAVGGGGGAGGSGAGGSGAGGSGSGGSGGSDVAAAAERGVAGASAPLPHLDAIQQAFGKHDVSGVRAQVGGAGAEAAGELGAEAYATGDRVAFAQSPDLHTAAHEAAHVVQQAGGVQLKDGLGQVGDRYEQHADAVADAVVAGKSAEAMLDGFAPAAAPSSSSSAAGAPAAQRKAVQRVAAVYKSADQLKAMTLSAFDTYAHSQVDWATSATLGDDKERLRGLLAFARKDARLILDGFGSFSVDVLMMCGAGLGDAEVDAVFVAYAKGIRRAGNTVHIEVPADDARMAVLWGEAVVKLVAKLTGPIAQRVIAQNASYQGLRALTASDDVLADFIKYYDAVTPLLDAKEGKEIKSYLAFRAEGGQAKVAKYKAGLKEVKNYHRFTVPQLELMHKNRELGPTNPAKVWSYDISVVLQTAFDHNAAFHRDENMTSVLNRFSYLTLIAEGKGTLAEFSTELATFATFSKDRKVKEVMIAGHGNAKSMELAGTSNADKKNVTVRGDAPADQRLATTTFLDSIKAVLRDDPAARLVLNACLTGSNSVDGVVLDPDPATAAQQIKDAIRDNPSLANRAKARMGTNRAQVRGANGSFGKIGLLDGSSMDLVAGHDPKLTDTKLEYVKAGTNPTGVLRAVLESWAQDKATTIAAVKARVTRNAGDTSWKERVIVSAMKLIKAAPDDAARIRMLEDVAGGLDHLVHRGDGMVAALKRSLPAAFNQGFMDAVFTDMTAADLWTDASYSFIPLVMYQAWIAKNAAKINPFLTFLNTSAFTTQNAGRFFDLPHLLPMIAQLLPDLVGVPPRGSFLIALLYLTKQRAAAPAEAKAYIASVVGDGRQDFPGNSKVDEILKGASKRSVLEDAGVLAAAVQGGPAAAVANLAPTGAGDNALTVDSVTEKCRTQGAAATNAYMLPAGTRVGTIPTGTALHVIGKVRAPVQVPPLVPLPVVHPGADAQPQPVVPLLPPAPVDLLAVEHTIGTDKTVFVVAADVQMI